MLRALAGKPGAAKHALQEQYGEPTSADSSQDGAHLRPTSGPTTILEVLRELLNNDVVRMYKQLGRVEEAGRSFRVAATVGSSPSWQGMCGTSCLQAVHLCPSTSLC